MKTKLIIKDTVDEVQFKRGAMVRSIDSPAQMIVVLVTGPHPNKPTCFAGIVIHRGASSVKSLAYHSINWESESFVLLPKGSTLTLTA